MSDPAPAAPATKAPRSLFGRVVANTGVLLGGRSVNAVLSLGYVAVTARSLGVERFGVLVLIHAFAQAVGDCAKFQSWQAILHFGARPLAEGRVGDLQRVVRFSAMLDLISAVGGILIGIIGALGFSHLLGWPPAAVKWGVAYAFSIAFMVSATGTGILRLYDRFDLIAAQSAIGSAVRLAGGILAYLAHADVPVWLAVWAAGSVASFAYLIVTAAGELHRRGHAQGFRWRGGGLTEGFPGIWRFAWTTNLNTTLDLAFTHVATLMVGGLLNPSQAALWRVARQVGEGIARPAKLLTPALYPELARLRAQGESRQFRKLGLQVSLAGGALATVLLLVSVFAGRTILFWIMGKAFRVAAPAMTWQVAAAVLAVWALPLEPMLISTGRPGAALRVRLVVSVLFLVCLPTLVHHFGIVGAGIGSTLAAGLMGVGMLLAVLRWYRAERRTSRRTPPPAPRSPLLDQAAP